MIASQKPPFFFVLFSSKILWRTFHAKINLVIKNKAHFLRHFFFYFSFFNLILEQNYKTSVGQIFFIFCKIDSIRSIQNIFQDPSDQNITKNSKNTFFIKLFFKNGNRNKVVLLSLVKFFLRSQTSSEHFPKSPRPKYCQEYIFFNCKYVIYNGFLVLGDPRTNQHPPLLVFGILFYRWHNVIAARVQHEHTEMTDEEIFQRTRRIVVGTFQVSIAEEKIKRKLHIRKQ